MYIICKLLPGTRQTINVNTISISILVTFIFKDMFILFLVTACYYNYDFLLEKSKSHVTIVE